MHLGLKRSFQVMSGAQWLELLCKHIPDRYEQLVRYCGWYSSRSRGARAAKGAPAATISSGATEALSEFASRAKAAWGRLIRKVYEADPLECPKCKGPMRVIALIEDPRWCARSSRTWGCGNRRRPSAHRPCLRAPSLRTRARSR